MQGRGGDGSSRELRGEKGSMRSVQRTANLTVSVL
jgi:hypothetical protein